MKTKLVVAAFAILFIFPSAVSAKLPQKIDDAVLSNYSPAVPHGGLVTAYNEPDPAKMRGYVVVMKSGIPVEMARYFIEWDNYDYRGVVVHLDKGGEVTTRAGAPYAYLQPGDVMAVAGVKDFAGTVYLKLLSAEVYIPESRLLEKRYSRVTVMLGFKFPKEVFKNDDAEAVIKEMGEWLKPFSNVDDAKKFAATIGSASKAGQASQASQAEDAKMKRLEEKINAAKKQMEEAEKEMKEMKKGR